MKARVKATGEIVEVTPIMKHNVRHGQYFESVEDEAGRELNLKDVEVIASKDTSIPDCGEDAICIDPSISYWEKLFHQYAGMAMQGLLSNPGITERELTTRKGIVEDAERLAHALVEKMKENEKAMH